MGKRAHYEVDHMTMNKFIVVGEEWIRIPAPLWVEWTKAMFDTDINRKIEVTEDLISHVLEELDGNR